MSPDVYKINSARTHCSVQYIAVYNPYHISLLFLKILNKVHDQKEIQFQYHSKGVLHFII